MSFFGQKTGVSDTLDLPPVTSDIPQRRLLSWEKELLGIYISDHPLTPYLSELTQITTHFSSELEETSLEKFVISGHTRLAPGRRWVL